MDAMQEVFVAVLQNRNTLNVRYPSSLLYTMATNHCLNVIRSRKKYDSSDMLGQIAGYDEEFERSELQMIIDKIFKQHSVSTRLIATLHYVDGLTLDETAEVSGMSVSGIRKRLAMLSKQVTLAKDNVLCN